MNTLKNYFFKVGGLTWSSELLSGKLGYVHPKTGICYYAQLDAIKEADKQDLRLPTDEEYMQFHKRTTHKWVEGELNGKRIFGMLFKDRWKWYNPFKRRNSIFFPALGLRSTDGSIYSVGDYGYYWSESVNSADIGYNLSFGSGYVNPQRSSSRRLDFPVRCVIK